jgi:NADH:ubiquinone oxidoreductase subunit 5 (subunit L)/multisubunit Na+/H+ antiporter MnhA subunit
MMGPLAVLAVLSIVGGFALAGPLEDWLGRTWGTERRIAAEIARAKTGTEEERVRSALALGELGHGALEKARASGLAAPVLAAAERQAAAVHKIHLGMMGVSALIFAAGAGAAFVLYTRRRSLVASWVEGPLKGLHRAVSNKFYVDEIYEILVIAPVKLGATLAWFLVDRVLIDALCVTGSAKLVSAAGWALRKPHTGSINAGLAVFTAGAVAALAWLLYRIQGTWIFPS